MKIKTDQFCGLATSPSFQSWLYYHDVELYRKFMSDLRLSKGCSHNREMMLKLLDDIRDTGGNDSLIVFISRNYKYMIDGNDGVVEFDGGDVFIDYKANILTYPRRVIFSGENKSLVKRAREFLLDKLSGDYIIVGDKLYIEYLNKSDSSISGSIPIENWQIANYRRKR